MSKPFDATLKELVTNHPVDWLEHLGIPITAPPEILNVDLSTVTAAVDTLIKVGESVVHIDIESGPDDDLGKRFLLYNVLAHYHTGLSVHSVVVLLRPKAVGRDLQDVVEYGEPDGCGLRFRFQIIRVWELNAEALLRGGVGLMPLAVLGRPPDGQTRLQALPAQVERMRARARRERPAEAGVILSAAFILATMHVGASVAESIFSKVCAMDDSDFPGVAFLEERGARKHARALIVMLARTKFGEPTEKQVNKLTAIDDIERLDRIGIALLSATNWDALLRVK